jgi:putative PIN family toxin of toxin-antitoxin system
MLRVVIDTGVIMSALLQPEGASKRAFVIALWDGVPLVSPQTFAELAEVVQRLKFRGKVEVSTVAEILNLLATKSELVVVTSAIEACRDPKDNMFLALAIDGRADVIISRDPDLLTLHPFQGIPIVSPADFLKMF